MISSMEDRARLASQLYHKSFDYFESKSDSKNKIGIKFTYLLRAILDGVSIELDCSFSENQELVKHLRDCFGLNHPVWDFIHLEF